MGKKKPHIDEYKAWLSIGMDHNPIGISWYRDQLQVNVKRVRVSVIPTYQFKKLMKYVRRGSNV